MTYEEIQEDSARKNLATLGIIGPTAENIIKAGWDLSASMGFYYCAWYPLYRAMTEPGGSYFTVTAGDTTLTQHNNPLQVDPKYGEIYANLKPISRRDRLPR